MGMVPVMSTWSWSEGGGCADTLQLMAWVRAVQQKFFNLTFCSKGFDQDACNQERSSGRGQCGLAGSDMTGEDVSVQQEALHCQHCSLADLSS
jgi:hypothetical protein